MPSVRRDEKNDVPQSNKPNLIDGYAWQMSFAVYDSIVT